MNNNSAGNLRRFAGAAIGVALLVVGCSQGSDSSSSTTQASTPPASTPPAAAGAGGASGSWASVSGILTTNCVPCHSGGRAKAGFDASSYDSVMKGSMQGPIVAAGKPDDSVIVKAILGADGLKKMPPRGALAQPDIDSIKAWIQAGAKQS